MSPRMSPRLPPVFERLRRYALLTRQDKPIGTLLLLWPTLTALWLAAAGQPRWGHVIVLTLGTWLMRSAGCAFNDLADRNFDGYVKRTAQRVLPAGAVSPGEAIAVGVVLLALSASLLLWLNVASFWLAVIAALVAVSYPWFKRFFPLPQAYLGIAFSFGIPIAYAAVIGRVPAAGWWLFAANLFWVIAYDTEYAMVDRDDDIKLGLRSSAILFGRADVAAVMACYGMYLSLVLLLGKLAGLGLAFVLGWLAALGCAIYHYTLIRTRGRDACFRAFLHNHWLGFALFAGVVLNFALR
jgi:4-hydroxybenzoate polyprenyltransferase